MKYTHAAVSAAQAPYLRWVPNWCHCYLTVKGDPEELTRFVGEVAETVADEDGCEHFIPFSFNRVAPEPTAQEYAALAETECGPCRDCAATGHRPRTRAEADELERVHGGRANPWPDTWSAELIDERSEASNGCSTCGGTGRALPRGDGWYYWRLQHWGTKWNASFDGPGVAIGGEEMDISATGTVIVTADVVSYSFLTAWSPPYAVVEAAAERWPNLEFVLRWAEPGCGDAGETTWAGGIETDDEDDLAVEDVLADEEMWF